MKGVNCWMGSVGYGSKPLVVENTDHGLTILPYAGGGESRNARTVYTGHQVISDFKIGIVFTTVREADGFADWIVNYGRKLSKPSITVGPMRVVIPSRNFDKLGIPVSGVKFGTKTGRILHKMQLTFKGTDGVVSKTNASRVRPSKRPGRYAYRWFYPFSSNLQGKDRSNDRFWDEPMNPDDDDSGHFDWSIDQNGGGQG